MDPLFGTLIALCMALLFGAAALAKVVNVRAFQTTLAGYALVPPRLLPLAARLIPVVEGTVGFAWLVGSGGVILASASAGILIGYALALAANLVRGRVQMSCGCSFAGGDDRISWWLVLRNALLALFALLALVPTTDRALGLPDFALCAAAVPAVALLYLAAQQLIANDVSMARGRPPAEAGR